MTSVASPPATRRPDPAAPHPPGGGWHGRMPDAAELALTLVTLSALAGFGRLFVGWSFLGPLAIVALVTHAVAVAGRRLRWPVMVPVLASAGVALVVLGLLRYREVGSFGLPRPAVWDAMAADLRDAWRQFPTVVAPVRAETGWIVAGAFGAWAAAIAADTLAFRLRGGFEALVPSGVLFVFASMLSADQYRLPLSALYLGSCLLFVLAYRAQRQATGPGWLAGSRRPAVAGSLLRAGGVVALGAIALGLLVGPALPGAGEPPLVDWKSGGRGTRITVSPLVDVRGRLVQQSSVEAFTVESAVSSYWRLTSLDVFDGEVWSSEGTYRDAAGNLPVPTLPQPRQRTLPVTQRFTIAELASIWLPAAFAPIHVEGGTDVRFDPESASLVTGQETSDGQTYEVTSAIPVLDPTAVIDAPPGAPESITSRYLELPDDLPVEVRDLALQLTATAATPYEQALALQDFFRSGFVYDTDVRPGHDEDAILSFLTDRRGYCEQFAGTFAAMARAVGLPARVAVGFTPGELVAPGTYLVRGEHAHAWPEVWLAGVGWVPFEPTPGRSAPGAEGYTGIAEPGPGQATTTTTTSTTVAPGGPGTTLSQDELDALGGLVPEDSGAAGAAGGADAGSPWPGRFLTVLLVLLGVAGLWALMVPGLRAAVRARHRARADTGAARVVLAWSEALDALRVAGLAPRPAETRHELARRAGALLPPAADAARRLADAAAAADYGQADLPAAVVRRAEEDAAHIRATVAATVPPRTRLRAALDPRDLVSRRARRRSVAEAAHGTWRG
ncbi:MAG: transglutaminase domain-containing protein [Acidimicrobiales bacterium]|nr:transglutaminase domain-containing protein [Acidimicrobiales bacterium]